MADAHLALTPIYTVFDRTHADLVRAALADEGIPCTIEGGHQGGFTGVISIRLLVPAEHVDDARAFLVEHEERFADEEE